MNEDYQFLIKVIIQAWKEVKNCCTLYLIKRGNVMSNKIMIERNIGVLREKIRNADTNNSYGLRRYCH